MANQFLQAMIIPSSMGLLAYTVSAFYGALKAQFVGGLYTTMSVKNSDPSFDAIMEFVGKLCEKKQNNYMVQTKKKKMSWRERLEEYRGNGSRAPPELDFVPSAVGGFVHVMTFKGCRILVSRVAGKTVTTGYERTPMEMETLTLSCWGRKGKG